MKIAIPIGISLPTAVLQTIDFARGDIPRSKYILRLLEKVHTQGTYENRQRERENIDSLDRRFETLQSGESANPRGEA